MSYLRKGLQLSHDEDRSTDTHNNPDGSQSISAMTEAEPKHSTLCDPVDTNRSKNKTTVLGRRAVVAKGAAEGHRMFHIVTVGGGGPTAAHVCQSTSECTLQIDES